jgi:platelet-activating factor acetylhydrolase IB subunit alpha
VRKCRMSPDGLMLASCSNDQSVKLWNYSSGKEESELLGHSHVVECIAWAPAESTASINCGALGPEAEPTLLGPFFASAGRDKTIVVWDSKSASSCFKLKGHDNWIKGVCFHPGGNYLLSCADDKSIRVWDLKTKRCFKTMEAHGHFVNAVDMHPTSPFVVSGGVDNMVKVWECR